MVKDNPTMQSLNFQLQQLTNRYNKLEKYVQWKIQGNDPSTNWGFTPLIVQQQGQIPLPLIIEVPAGTMNGSNKVFTLTFQVTNSWILLELNGVYQEPTTDYTLSGKTITFTVAPKASDYSLEALYISAGS